MYTVVGIRFKKAGKIYYFSPNELDIKKEDFAIVETARGVEFGQVMVGKKTILEEDIVSPLKDVIRIATPEDVEKNIENKEKASYAFDVCLEKIDKHELDMKLIDVEYTFDNNKVIFYFTADGRVDFRELVKDLAAIFRTRIELRQIGVRDEAKMVGGYGSCGRPLCCSTFLGDFAPVSIKMAKEQGLSLNPTKISGVCGRLMCCLNYEEEGYKECLKKMPKRGEIIKTKFGTGVVMDTNVLGQKVKAKIRNEEDFDQVMQIDIADIEKRNCCKEKAEKLDKMIEESKLVAEEDFTEEDLLKLEDKDESVKAKKKQYKNNKFKGKGDKKPFKKFDKNKEDSSKTKKNTGKPQKTSPRFENRNSEDEGNFDKSKDEKNDKRNFNSKDKKSNFRPKKEFQKKIKKVDNKEIPKKDLKDPKTPQVPKDKKIEDK